MSARYEDGQCALSGARLALYRGLDRLFAAWAAECGAEEHAFPPFIPASALARIGYFQSFPHLVGFPVALDADPANLRRFSAANRAGKAGAVRLSRIEPPRQVLTPAACYHFYHGLQGARLDAATVLTTRANCFRRESHYAALERQWSFTMREIVCLGPADEVKAFLACLRERLARFFRERELPVSWQAATDPFFDPAHNGRYLAQKLDPLKTEMVLEGRLAIGSVNFHRSTFGEAFDIRCGGAPAFSGCVAFGMERWMHAFLSHYGADERAWGLP
jgi:hypothetical protein